MKTPIQILCFLLLMGSGVLYAQGPSAGAGPTVPDPGSSQEHVTDNSGDRNPPVGDPAPPDPESGGAESDEVVAIYHNWPWDVEAAHRVTKNDYNISWKDDLTSSYYVVTIREQGADADMFTEVTKRKSTIIPFRDINLDADKTYVLKIMATGNLEGKVPVSYSSKIKIGSDKEKNIVLSAVKAMPEFDSADKMNKLFLKARGLELNGYLLDAARYFEQYMESDQDDMTLRNLRDAFRERNKLYSIQ
jgi:hypothetical protein